MSKSSQSNLYWETVLYTQVKYFCWLCLRQRYIRWKSIHLHLEVLSERVHREGWGLVGKSLLFSRRKCGAHNGSLPIGWCSEVLLLQVDRLDVEGLFSNIESVHQISAKLLSLLEEATTDVEPAMQVIGMFVPSWFLQLTGNSILITPWYFGFMFLMHKASQEIYKCRVYLRVHCNYTNFTFISKWVYSHLPRSFSSTKHRQNSLFSFHPFSLSAFQMAFHFVLWLELPWSLKN